MPIEVEEFSKEQLEELSNGFEKGEDIVCIQASQTKSH